MVLGLVAALVLVRDKLRIKILFFSKKIWKFKRREKERKREENKEFFLYIEVEVLFSLPVTLNGSLFGVNKKI